MDRFGDEPVTEREGAVWFTSPELDADAVLIRSPEVIPDPENRPTYLASDIAYAWNKLVERGFADDVRLAEEVDADDVVPILENGRYVAAS